MGRVRDDLRDSMWDEVTCKKHGWTGPDSRFSCPSCDQEAKEEFSSKRDKATKILKPYGLADMVRYW